MLLQLNAQTLRRQLVLVLGLAGFFPLLIATVVVVPSVRDHAETRAAESLTRNAASLADGLRRQLEAMFRDTASIAHSPTLTGLSRDDPQDWTRQLEALLVQWPERSLACEVWSEDRRLARAVAPGKTVAESVPTWRDPSRPTLSTLQREQHRWSIQVAHPLPDFAKPPLTLVWTWDAYELVRGPHSLQADLEIALLDSEGLYVLCSPNPVATPAPKGLRASLPADASVGVQTAYQSENGDRLATIEPLSAFVRGVEIPTPFDLVLSRSREDARLDVAGLERAILFSGIGVTLIICLAAWFLARSLGGPLATLTARVESFAVRCHANGHRSGAHSTQNEVQLLGDAFEKMADRVEEHQETMYQGNVELQSVLERLRATDQVKDEFLSFLSHEMRTPLTAIRSFAELLRTTPDITDAEQQEFLGIIESESNRLETLSCDLLDLARIQLGEMPWRNGLVDPSEVIDSVGRTLRVLAERTGAHLSVQSRPDLPPLSIDRDRLVQVLTNLAANAMKFTPPGGQVTLRATLMGEEDGDDQLCLEVIDTGPGIPEHRLKDVFAPFVQAHAESGDAPRGAGLGLAICQRIVHHYGGEIDARNGQHGGAILRVLLPLTAREAQVHETSGA